MDPTPALVAIPLRDLSPEYFFTAHPTIAKLVISGAIGLLLGVEREWAQKPAGMRTFTLITLTGTVMTILDDTNLLMLGALLVVVQGSVLALRGLAAEGESMLLTTSVSMLLAYGVGVLIGRGFIQEGVLVAVLASFLLVLRRELHGFAQNLSKREIRSALEFSIIAFVIFPLLPAQGYGPGGVLSPRSIWLLIVAVSAIGFINYLVVTRYGARGVAITSFFGGLVNSTAVIGELVSRSRSNPSLSSVTVGAIVLANAAMALRDLLIVATFVPELILQVGPPLAAVTVTGVALSYVTSDWDVPLEMEFDSPFNLRTAFKFGTLFVLVLFVAATARTAFGGTGLLVSSFFGGMISSAAVTTSIVVLVQSGQLSTNLATLGVVTAVTASILVKALLVLSMKRSIARPVGVATVVLIAAGLLAAASVQALG